MAVSLVQAVAGTGASATLTLPGVVSQNTLICEIRIGALGATVTVSDSVNGSWSQASAQPQTTDGDTLYVFYLARTASGSPLITVSTSGGSVRLNASEWSGLAASPLGVSSGVDGGSGGPVDSGAISVTAGDLVFGAAGNSNSVAASWTAGGTSAGGTWAVVNTYNDVNHQVMSQYVVATATGSYSSFPTQASFTFCTSQVIQFKAPSVSAASVMLPMGMLGTGRV